MGEILCGLRGTCRAGFWRSTKKIWMLSPRQHACATASTFFGCSTAQVIYSCEPLRISITTFPNRGSAPKLRRRNSSAWSGEYTESITGWNFPAATASRAVSRSFITARVFMHTPHGCFFLPGNITPGIGHQSRSNPRDGQPVPPVRVPSPRSAGQGILLWNRWNYPFKS